MSCGALILRGARRRHYDEGDGEDDDDHANDDGDDDVDASLRNQLALQRLRRGIIGIIIISSSLQAEERRECGPLSAD